MGSRGTDVDYDWYKRLLEPDGIIWDDNLVDLFSDRDPNHWAADIPRHHVGIYPPDLKSLRAGDSWYNPTTNKAMIFEDGGWREVRPSMDVASGPDMTGISVIPNDTIRNNERLFREFQEYNKKHLNQIFKIDEDV